MLLDLIDIAKLRRAVSYSLLFVALFVVQDLLASHITIRGVRPMLIPAAVACVGLFDGGLWGGLTGLAAGLFMDMGYTEHVCLFAVLLAGVGFFSGVLGKYLLHRGFVSYMALAALTMLLVTFCQMFRFLFFTDTASWAVWRTGVLQLLWSLPWAVPVYFPCRSIASHALER